jgi:hypothetical protein
VGFDAIPQFREPWTTARSPSEAPVCTLVAWMATERPPRQRARTQH